MNQNPVLSILIPSTYDRNEMLQKLLKELMFQIQECDAVDLVEVLTEIDGRTTPTGTKRNLLYQKAAGIYSVSADDDDYLYPYYVEEILKAAKTDCDAMAINGLYTENGVKETQWFISKDYGYCASKDANGKEIYLRYPNHITPIRSSIAKQFKFPDIYQGEDYAFATALHNSRLIQTETVIEKPLYHYKYLTNKTA